MSLTKFPNADNKPKTVRRIARFTSDRGRKIIVSLEYPDVISFRPYRLRKAFRLSVSELYILAATKEADRIRAERRRVGRRSR